MTQLGQFGSAATTVGQLDWLVNLMLGATTISLAMVYGLWRLERDERGSGDD